MKSNNAKSTKILLEILLYLIMLVPIILNVFLIVLVSKWCAFGLLLTVPNAGLISAIIHMLDEDY